MAVYNSADDLNFEIQNGKEAEIYSNHFRCASSTSTATVEPNPRTKKYIQSPMQSPSTPGSRPASIPPNFNRRVNTIFKAGSVQNIESQSEINFSKEKRKFKRMFSVTIVPKEDQPNMDDGLKTPTSIKSSRTNLNKNDNMVMQLVLPSTSVQNTLNESNYLTASSLDEILDSNYGSSTKLHNVNSPQDMYSTIGNNNNNNSNAYVNQAFAFDFTDYGRNFQMESTTVESPSLNNATADDHLSNKSTKPEEKIRAFRDLLTRILSGVYALFILTLGIAVYVSDVVDADNPIAETFSLYLVIIALVFVLYLTLDITFYMRKKYEYNNLIERHVIYEDIEMKPTPDGNYHLNIPLPDLALKKHLEHHYCLDKDKHSANFYLKIGAAGFCLGHLVHSGLLLGYQIIFLTSEDDKYYGCSNIQTLTLDFVYPMYSFFLLYFIFKYSNIIINRHIALARFGIMHCMSSSLCFWLWTIFRETIESVSNHSYENDKFGKILSAKNVALFSDKSPLALPLSSYNKRGAKLLTSYLNLTVRRFSEMCGEGDDEGMKRIYQNYSPYLYPFSVEYSILVVAVLFIIWQNIGSCKESRVEVTSQQQHQYRQCNTPSGNDDNLESNIVIHADCHSANKGLFGGIMILVVAVVSIILFFVSIEDDDDDHINMAIMVNIITFLTLTILMTITSIVAYRQITKLDVDFGYHNLLDELLLFVCIPAFFLNGIFSMIPAILLGSPLGITLTIFEVIQILVQTPFIIDGLRRCSNSRELRKKKPGRELVTFLIVCNVAMWILHTFQIEAHGLQDHRYDFYGYELWTIIGHMCIPLIMFYRFHSSVCLVDIWKFAYEPSNHHHKTF